MGKRVTVTIDSDTYRLLRELGRIKGTFKVSKTIRLLVKEELERLAEKHGGVLKEKYEEYVKMKR